ncbi:MAG: hypothetical protein WDZ37_02290 [Solirubrobacterales bacterium]
MSTIERPARLVCVVAAPILVLVALAGAPAQAKAPSGPVPNGYISNYAKRGTDCTGWRATRGNRWVRWQTYAAGAVGSRWAVVASADKLCAAARSAAKTVIGHTVAGWPDDPFPIAQALAVRGHEDRFEQGAPRGWRCYVLPSQWGLHAKQLAAEAGEPLNQGSGAFGAAQGLVNSFSYCVTSRARRDVVDGDGKWHGGEYIAWGPKAARCDIRLALRGEQQKDGSTIYPPFYQVQAGAPAYYNTAPC